MTPKLACIGFVLWQVSQADSTWLLSICSALTVPFHNPELANVSHTPAPLPPLCSLLALSAVCPGASTLIGNLLKSATVRPLESMQRTLAGRQWLRAYVNGCAYQVGGDKRGPGEREQVTAQQAFHPPWVTQRVHLSTVQRRTPSCCVPCGVLQLCTWTYHRTWPQPL